MSSSEVTLTVEAGDRAAEIFVIDGGYRLVGRGLGSLHERYPPGLYKVKVQSGLRSQEGFVRLAPGEEALLDAGAGMTLERVLGGARVQFPRLGFATAVPLAGLSRSRERQGAEAAARSRAVHVRRGAGSQVFLFVRCWGASATGEPTWTPRLTLRDEQGAPVVDLSQEGERDLGTGEPWAACNVQVAPGRYRLRMEAGEGVVLERTIVAPAGWQAQVFLCQRRGPARAAVSSSLGYASVHLRLIGAGFDPESLEVRLAELARLGLRNRRRVISRELLDDLLWAKSSNPMLGIYGGHLLLLAPEPDLVLLRKVVEALRSMLGEHPDVEALALRLGERAGSPRLFEVPPMLLSSWRLIVKETLARPGLVPRGSLAARIADRLWGEGPWVTWREPSAESAPAVEQRATSAEEALRRLRVTKRGHSRFGELTALEEALLSRVRGPSGSPVPPMSRLVTALGVPAATVEDAAVRLVARLRE